MRLPDECAEVSQVCACRNDGVYFHATAVLWDEDLAAVMDPGSLRAEKSLQAKFYLDTFLDSKCECRPGFDCIIHARNATIDAAIEEAYAGAESLSV